MWYDLHVSWSCCAQMTCPQWSCLWSHVWRPLPFQMMQAAADVLAGHSIKASCVARPGLAHGIDPDALTQAIDFLADHLPD